MKVFTIAYMVNDSEKFNSEIMSGVMDSMRSFNEENDYGVFAVSKSNEFEKIEKIEAIINDFDLCMNDKLSEITDILGGM